MEQSRHRVVSLFSGAMGLDLGLERAGLETAVCVEWDKDCCATMRHNRPALPVIEADISAVPTAQVLNAAGLEPGEAFAVVGGPPCQSFSTGGLRQSISDRRGSLFADFVRIVEEARPLYFVFENVSQIITAAVKHRPISERPGKRWHLSSYSNGNGNGKNGHAALVDDGAAPLEDDEQAGSALRVILDTFDGVGYSLTFGVLNAADFGAAQRRLRFVVLGSRVQGNVPLPQPTHSSDPNSGLPAWRTLRDAIGDLREENPQHACYGPDFSRYFSMVPPGGNWRDLPPDIQREALGERAYVAGGGKTGFFRRLSWDEPTPTIVGKPNRKSCAVCHPSEIRPLTVRESARVQGFPDEWEFQGGMHPQYLQVGNAVPVELGEAVGRALLLAYSAHLASGGGQATPDELHAWKARREEMLAAAQRVVRAAARNKRTVQNQEKARPSAVTLSLFG